MCDCRFIALAGDVVVGRGRTPNAAYRAASAALITSYTMDPFTVHKTLDVEIEVRRAPPGVYRGAPHRTEDLMVAAEAALRAAGVAHLPPTNPERSH